MQAVTTNINPNRLEHTNKRDTGHVLPRDHDQEPKKSFVGWDQEYSSSTTKDQGKYNMGSEMKSMRKPGEESLVVKQEYLSNNVVKPKPVVDNPTGYDPFLLSKRESTTDVLVGGDSNDQDDVRQKRRKVLHILTLQKMSWTALHGQVLHLKRRRKVDSKHTAMISSSEVPQYSQGDNPRVQRKTPSKEKENKEAAPFFVAKKNIAVPFSSTNIEARRNKTSTTTGSYGKGDQPKKGGCPCSIL